MKSLEIVNSHIKSIVDYLDNPQVKEDIDCLNIMCVGISHKDLQTIKQDLERLQKQDEKLEVLNILKNKEVDIFLLNDTLKSFSYDIEGALKFYNNEFVEEYNLTLDEIYTINKWLRGE